MTADVPPDAEAAIARVADRVTLRLPEVTHGMRAVLGQAIAELVGDDRLLDLLGGAIEGNVATVLHMLRRRVPLPEVEVPSAAVAHARRLAQRGVPVFALVRAYRLGQGYLLDECFAELRADSADPQQSLLAFNAINVRILAYIDWVSQEVVTAYETERDQWVRNRDTVRTAQILQIVGSRAPTDLAAVEAALGYRLRQHHVAAILWTDEDTTPDSLGRLEAATVLLARELSDGSAPLTVAAEGNATWAWFPRGADPADADVRIVETALRSAELHGVRVALGGAGAGMEGFRDSHHQAVEAQHVLLTGAHSARLVIGHREPGVSAAALLARDIERTRLLVRSVLGPLAADDSSSERLRETLLTYLECGSSYTATAARHALHKNSVKYRVERALDQRGRPLGDDRIDVELALVACRWLRGRILDR